MKRQLQETDRKLAFLEARERKRLTARPKANEDALKGTRFSARSVRSQRNRLKLSAEDYGSLVGVSGQTIYHWEQGKSRPRRSQIAALAAVRGIGKREALRRLEMLGD